MTKITRGKEAALLTMSGNGSARFNEIPKEGRNSATLKSIVDAGLATVARDGGIKIWSITAEGVHALKAHRDNRARKAAGKRREKAEVQPAAQTNEPGVDRRSGVSGSGRDNETSPTQEKARVLATDSGSASVAQHRKIPNPAPAMNDAPIRRVSRFTAAVIKGLVEHGDPGYYFHIERAAGCELAHAIELGLIDQDGDITPFGQSFYGLNGLASLQDRFPRLWASEELILPPPMKNETTTRAVAA